MPHDLLPRLLREARSAKTVRAFWQGSAEALSAWGAGMRVTITYVGRTEQGTVEAGAASPGGAPPLTLRREDEGRRVAAVFESLPSGGGRTRADAEAALEVAARLALLVGQRTRLERDQQLGNFILELSRWLLAAPERDLMLRYTLQSVMKLYEAEGAFAALHEPARPDGVRVVTALGSAVEMKDMLLPLQGSTTGRVVRQGEAVATDNIREEPDVYLAANPTGTARAAMIAPLHSSGGTLGAIAIVRYRRETSSKDPPTFSLADLHFFTAVAAHVAGGLELSHVVAKTREAADRAAAMVDASPLPLALVDHAGRVHQLNEAARVVFGLEQASNAAGRYLDGLGLDVGPEGIASVLARRPGSEPWRGMVAVNRPGGDQRTCDCTITSLEGLGSTDLLVALHDRTEELRVQREMIAREKLATVGELAGGVAHEVNNPLTAIRMEAEMLQRARKDAETDAAADTIVREVDRASRIVRSLLRLARRADTTPVPVQLNDVLADVAEIRRRILKSENVDLTIETDHAAPSVLGLGQELLQVVLNLVTNAEHAVRGRERATIVVATQSRPGWVRLTVDDSGPGVPAAIRHRIFDPFFTTKDPDEGSGLGLAICQRTVSEVGGKLWLEDSMLGGARFVVDLPAAPDWAATRPGR